MQTIVVTGSASGLGLEIATLLLGAGYHVVGVDLSDQSALECHPFFTSVFSDVAWEHGGSLVRQAAVDSPVIEEFDLLGIINCAGVNHNSWFTDVRGADMIELMRVNAFSMVYMTQPFLSDLERSGGFVLNIVSNAAHMPMTSSLAYNASKAAALMITKQMAHELTKSHGITVFSISPNKLAGTGMSREIESNVCVTRGWTPEFAAEYQKKSLMHGLETDPKAIAYFISHLLESGSWKFMSGTDIPFGK